MGSPFNTYGAPGVEKYAFRVKEVEDALAVRGRLIDMLETASLPGQSEEERRKMCAVVVVGGGPIGVSIAAGKGREGSGGERERGSLRREEMRELLINTKSPDYVHHHHERDE